MKKVFNCLKGHIFKRHQEAVFNTVFTLFSGAWCVVVAISNMGIVNNIWEVLFGIGLLLLLSIVCFTFSILQIVSITIKEIGFQMNSQNMHCSCHSNRSCD